MSKKLGKHTINYTDPDKAKYMLSCMMKMYMEKHHADVIEEMKQFIKDEFDDQSEDSRDSESS